MRSAVLGLLVLLASCWSPAAGWGYIFSRFRPEAGPNWGYGGVGQQYQNTIPAERMVSPREQLMEALLGEEVLEDQLCEGRRCTANEQCCGGHVCVEFDGASGTCMSSLVREKVICATEKTRCRWSIVNLAPVFLPGKSVTGSSSCTLPFIPGQVSLVPSAPSVRLVRSLLSMVRRHRQAPKTLCGYFKDPMICIGHVASEQAEHIVEHTKGEKRLTGKSHDYVSI
nr:ITG-like peptide [Cherax quadricarinatus]